MAQADGMLESVSYNDIGDQLMHRDDAAWIVITRYAVGSAVQPSLCRLSDLSGPGRIIILCNIGFALGVAVLVCLDSFWTFVAVRAYIGVPGAGMAFLVDVVLNDSAIVATNDRPWWAAVEAGLYLIAQLLGGLGGGAIFDHYGRRWAFGSEMIVVVPAIFLCSLYLSVPKLTSQRGAIDHDTETNPQKDTKSLSWTHWRQLFSTITSHFDILGAVIWTLSVAMIFFALQIHAHLQVGQWQSVVELTLLTLGSFLGLVFIYAEIRLDNPAKSESRARRPLVPIFILIPMYLTTARPTSSLNVALLLWVSSTGSVLAALAVQGLIDWGHLKQKSSTHAFLAGSGFASVLSIFWLKYSFDGHENQAERYGIPLVSATAIATFETLLKQGFLKGTPGMSLQATPKHAHISPSDAAAMYAGYSMLGHLGGLIATAIASSKFKRSLGVNLRRNLEGFDGDKDEVRTNVYQSPLDLMSCASSARQRMPQKPGDVLASFVSSTVEAGGELTVPKHVTVSLTSRGGIALVTATLALVCSFFTRAFQSTEPDHA
ncbi:uncharacterized protein AB675_5471 [Cyphellophora attinorum]|uniref:Uncharacterized protein n=1 Tax=Cyphellophora attinorum TaxID=1664694 RepID=A0A0N0NNR9_9EURO|nr:uncharacterized protein AB675_5471 [Phialophora attinorum]KPI41868.1 hypothetical protein AB675_5471 [Phialophora attinorum]